jgi:hypothetical protein
MPGTTGPNLGLTWGWAPGESGWGRDGFNPGMALLDAVVHLAVLSSTIPAPPGSPGAGDRYIVPVPATGAWVGHETEVAVYRDGTWAYLPPRAGWTAWDALLGGRVWFDGTSWLPEEPPPHTHPQSEVDGLTAALASKAAGSALEALDLRVVALEDAPGGGGASTVADLTDGPGALTGHEYQGVRVAAGGAVLEYVDRPWEGSVFVDGLPEAGEVLIRHAVAGPIRVAAGLTGWRFSGAANATGSAVFSVRKNGVEFGTITVAAGTATGAMAAATATDFAGGDVLSVEAPGTQDATLASFSITAYGVRR